jgi:hypothetical protein
MRQLRKKKRLATKPMQSTRLMCEPYERSGKRSGARKCASKRRLTRNKNASRTRSAAKNVNWRGRRKMKRWRGGKRLMTNGERSVSVSAKSKGLLMTGSEKRDENDADGRIGTGIATMTAIMIGRQPIALIVECHAIGIQNEKSLPSQKMQPLRQLLLRTRSHSRKLL